MGNTAWQVQRDICGGCPGSGAAVLDFRGRKIANRCSPILEDVAAKRNALYAHQEEGRNSPEEAQLMWKEDLLTCMKTRDPTR